MGCDIHLVLEKREKTLGRWIGINTFLGHSPPSHARYVNSASYSYSCAISRNYERFARLAGVRGEGPPARGVPFDASETARFLILEFGSDGHNHSFITVAEAAAIFAATEGWRDFEGPDCYARKYPESFFFGVDSEDCLENYRLVFWFDN